MTTLSGSAQSISLGESGYAIRAPGFRGDAKLERPRSAAERSRSRAAEDGSEDLDNAFAATNLTEVRRVALQLRAASPTEAVPTLRSADDQDLLELEVPDLGAETGQLVLACDESGVLTWHFPLDEQQRMQTPASRGAGGVKRFRIPLTQQPAAPGGEKKRSLLGMVGRKLLKILVYPIIDPVVGAVSEFFAEKWESKNRPYGLRTFNPDNRQLADVDGLKTSDWQRLNQGRSLLFIHGTFSTAHGAFSQLPDEIFNTLHAHYQGRVFAFNHYTLSHDPRRNIEWLLSQLPKDQSLELDIICHSRGGLVARTLAERPSVFGLDTSRIAVRRIAFVAVPNRGTLLAHPDHMMNMVDRLTTALNIFPSGPVTETLEALITVLKVIGHGALKGLDGLAAMRPDGRFLQTLNQGATKDVEYYAVAADYAPQNEGLMALLTNTVADQVIDRVFEKTPNDLVVPEPGVYGKNGHEAFPIPSQRLLQIPNHAGVAHTTLFAYPPLNTKLTEWLT